MFSEIILVYVKRLFKYSVSLFQNTRRLHSGKILRLLNMDFGSVIQ